ncbi:MAG: YncE family protein [Thermoplasmata archaeon]|nr:YncE family protein [Thermoplasmata archaeon]
MYDAANQALYFSGLRTDEVGVLNATTLAPIAMISGSGGVAMALDASAQRLFVAGYWNDTLAVINCTDNRLVATVTLPSNPEFVALGPHDRTAYVPNGDGVSFVNTSTLQLESTLQASGFGLLTGAAFDPRDGLLYVSNTSDGVTPINVTTDTWAGGNTTIVGQGQFGSLWFDPLSGSLYLTDNLSSTMWIVNVSAGGNITSLPIGGEGLAGLAWDPATRTVFLPQMFGTSVLLLNASTGAEDARSVPVGVGSSVAVFDPSRRQMAVFNDATPNLTLINPSNLTVTATFDLSPQFGDGVAVPGSSWLVLADPSGNALYAYNRSDGQFLPAPIPVGDNPRQLVYDPASNEVFSASASDGTVSGTFVGNWTPGGPPTRVGADPDGLALGPNGTIVAVSCLSGTLEGLARNGAPLPNAPVDLGGCPVAVAADPAAATAYVANAGDDSVSIVNLSTYRTVGTPWALPGQPSTLGYDPSTGDLFVGYADRGNLTILSPTGVVLATLRFPSYESTQSFSFDPLTGLVYVTNDSGIAVFQNLTEVAGVPIRGSLAQNATRYRVIPGTSGSPAYVTSGLSGIEFLSDAPELAPLQVEPSTTLAGRTVLVTTAPLGPETALRYTYLGLPPGCRSADLPALSCRPSTSGTFSISVNASDAFGNWVRSSTQLTVAAANLSGVAIAVSPPVVDVGQTVTLASTVKGEGPNESFAYAGLPSGCGTANASSFECRPSAPGTSLITVSVRDAFGEQANGSSVLEVYPPPGIQGFGAFPPTTSVGGTVEFLLAVTGGAPGTPRLSVTGLPPGCAPPSGELWSCEPVEAGTFRVSATVEDSTGTNATAETTLTVGASAAALPPPAILSAFAAPDDIPVGGTVTIAVVAQGGATPLHYSYAGLPPGCVSTNSSVLSCHPAASGTFTVNATVSDSLGRSASALVSLVVTPLAATPAPGTTGSPAFSLAELGVVAIAAGGFAGATAAAIVVALVRRAKDSPRHRSDP